METDNERENAMMITEAEIADIEQGFDNYRASDPHIDCFYESHARHDIPRLLQALKSARAVVEAAQVLADHYPPTADQMPEVPIKPKVLRLRAALAAHDRGEKA